MGQKFKQLHNTKHGFCFLYLQAVWRFGFSLHDLHSIQTQTQQQRADPEEKFLKLHNQDRNTNSKR